MKYMLLLFSLMLASCTTSEYAVNAVSQAKAAAAAASPADAQNALAGLQPAPAGMSKAQARQFYAAQVDAAKAAQTQKVKNSNNTTVEQKISNISNQALALIAGLSAVVGFLLGAVIGAKFHVL